MNWPKIRAWGWYATLIRTPWFCVKLLRFKPYGALSMQRHEHRTEIWWFIKGYGFKSPNCGAPEFGFTRPFNIWQIKRSDWHQYTAGYEPVYALEFQYGKKVTENDIERK